MLETPVTEQSISHLIRHGQLQSNTWRTFEPVEQDSADTSPTLPADEPGWIVPIALWDQAAQTLRQRQHPVAILLAPDSTLNSLLADNGHVDPTGIAFIAIDFPVYTDGRGYSLAQLLRTQHGWQGELRAIGDVMIDTIHYQARVGFDSFVVKPGHDPEKALAAFNTFTVHYQKTYLKPASSLVA
jgi:uncharacterized protein (DUF934 family)